jgi:YD repeat-containing protein
MPFPAAGASGYLSSKDSFIFDPAQHLQKHVVYDLTSGTPQVGWSDSFAYANDNMVKSYFSLGTNSSISPYTTSEYDYSGHTLTGSRYYLGGTLLVYTTYQVDSSGRIISLTQYADNLTYQYTPTTIYDLTYDGNGNLVEVTDTAGGLYYQFLNYDDQPNPWNNLPFDFAYNLFDSNPRAFSKHNYRLEYDYSYFGDTLSFTYSYNYGSAGEISTFVQTPSNGRLSNGPGISHYDIVTYKCN